MALDTDGAESVEGSHLMDATSGEDDVRKASYSELTSSNPNSSIVDEGRTLKKSGETPSDKLPVKNWGHKTGDITLASEEGDSESSKKIIHIAAGTGSSFSHTLPNRGNMISGLGEASGPGHTSLEDPD